jgi:exonuclease SbcC
MIQLKSLKAQGIKNLKIPAEEDDFDKLEFPEEGKILIHGLNEAGKSTLFESIYFALFGTALIPDRSKASMSELLAYDRDKGVVELEFLVADSLYRIRRTIEDSGSRTSYSHELVIEHPDSDPEGVKGATQVNNRIQQELGLDGDALLNSCFVEQKNLDRLEDSSRRNREESIATLLNLDRFTAMENDYSSKQDVAAEELERAEQKREIAEIEEEKIPTKEAELEAIENKLQVIKWEQRVEELEGDIEDYDGRIEERKDEIANLREQIEEIEQLEQQLPEKQERKEKLDQLHADLQTLEELDEALSELDDLQTLDEEIEGLESDITELNEERDTAADRLEAVREKLAQYEYLDILNDWERLMNAATREERIEEQEQEHQQKMAEAEEELDEVQQEKASTASTRKQYLGAGAGVTVLALIVGAVVNPIAFIGVLLGIGVAVYGYTSYNPAEYDSQIESLEETVATHNKQLTQLEGRRKDLAETEAEDPSDELAEIESDITDMDRPVPSSLEQCGKRQSQVEDSLADEPAYDELESTEDSVSDKLSRTKQNIESTKEELSGKREEREALDEDEIQDRIRELKIDIVGEEQDREEIESALAERADDLDVEPDREQVNSVKSSLQTEIENDQEQIDEKSDIEQQIEEKEDKVEELEAAIEDAEDEIGDLEEKIADADADPEADEEDALNEERDDIVGDLGGLRDRRDDLRDELNLSEDLSLDKVEDEVDEKQHEGKLYEYAEEIVSQAKDQIMRNILPKTEANMARFLPILTNGRYKDVRIDAESYTIEAYDGRAQAYKSKSIFSGGTKDQFSLALRLSFAMATLPQERGTAPDFLYLDEPVGSFDSSRQEALTELLTRGEIAENFGQIFIVSHVEGLQEDFDSQIKMEDGRIAEMDLEV